MLTPRPKVVDVIVLAVVFAPRKLVEQHLWNKRSVAGAQEPSPRSPLNNLRFRGSSAE
jgi:hypothetical protein